MHRSLKDKASVAKLGELGSNPSGASLCENGHIPSVIAYACTKFNGMCGIMDNKLPKCVLNQTYPSREGIVISLWRFTHDEFAIFYCAVQ